MRGVERLDVGGHCGSPCGDDGGGTPRAAGLVGELPGEDGGGGLVAVDDGRDVVLIGGLDGTVGVEGGVARTAGESVDVDVHTAVVAPVIDSPGC